LDNGRPFVLQPFQSRVSRDVFARDRHGRPRFQEVWFIVPEQNGKTTWTAALCLYHIENVGEGYVPVAASSRDQAMTLWRQASGLVRRSSLDRDAGGHLVCHGGVRRVLNFDNDAMMQVFAADANTGDGVIPTLSVLDELHRHKNLELFETWAGKLDKRDAQLVVISVAGEPGSEFETLRERRRTDATRVERRGSFARFEGAGYVMHEWAVPDNGDTNDLEVVAAANPFRGMTKTRLKRKMARSVSDGHWRRFVCNQPTRATSAAISEVEWADAGGEHIPAGEPVWVGLDCGWRYDTTAIVPLWIRPDDPWVLGDATVLTPPRKVGESLSLDEVKRALSVVFERNTIDTLVMDLHDARDVAEWAEIEFGCRIVEHGQALTLQAVAYARFMELLRGGQLRHTGDADLRRHAMNAVARILPRGEPVFARRDHSRAAALNEQRVIDALVAAAMVVSTAYAELRLSAPRMSWRAF